MNSEELQKNFENIKKMYLEENKSSEEIAAFYGVKRHKINYILKKNNIQKSFSESRRKYNLDINYFDEIDTPNKAYILGFLYADGYNNRINNTVVLSLKREDEEILEKINKELKNEKPIYRYDYINNYDGKERHMSEVIFASKHMCESLEKLGVIQNKTFTITFPNFLKENLYPHFIRGLFDGDGCASIYNDEDRERFMVSIMSTKALCDGMKDFLKTQDINFNVNKACGKKDENALIRSGSNKENKKFMEYIYKDADLYMQRKYEKFLTFFKEN